MTRPLSMDLRERGISRQGAEHQPILRRQVVAALSRDRLRCAGKNRRTQAGQEFLRKINARTRACIIAAERGAMGICLPGGNGDGDLRGDLESIGENNAPALDPIAW